MRIGIAGQFGTGNVGDEGILLAIMDSLGFENEYIVSTSLPFNMVDQYKRRIPTVEDVRTLDDTRVDFAACLYGGGKIDWGFAWNYFIRAFENRIPAMAYGISVRVSLSERVLSDLYAEYFQLFRAVTERDNLSKMIFNALFVQNTLTMCPAINLKEEKTTYLGSVVACPRYGDYDEKGEVDNEPQIQWFVKRLAPYDKKSINLIPFHPKDLEGQLRDLELCNAINKRLGGGCNVFPCDGFNARKVKYAIVNSELVLSGGRYHAIVWAIAHDVPYEIVPTVSGIARAKLDGLIGMENAFGREKLLEMEKENKRLFEAMI